MCGKFLPEGTVVGCNAWTVHRDKNIYGADADDFRPERWMASEGSKDITNEAKIQAKIEAKRNQIRRMENLSFAFGGGPRVCIGKNIAMLEIIKFIPEFFRRFDVQLVDPARYKLRPGWLVLQEGLDCRLRRRDQSELVGC